MLTASALTHDRVEGLALGADDYLTKPFSYDELLARITALARRATPAHPPVMVRGALALDSARRRVTVEGRFVPLPRKEFGVLEVLMRADGAVVSSDDLIEQVWEENTSYRTNAVRITMSKLRSRLGDPALIETLPGEGYRIADDMRDVL